MFFINQKKIYLEKSGKTVATIDDDNNVVFARGKASLEPDLVAWLKCQHIQFANLPLPDALAERIIANDGVPPFIPALGILSPGLREFIAARNLSESEINTLIRKLEKKHHE